MFNACRDSKLWSTKNRPYPRCVHADQATPLFVGGPKTSLSLATFQVRYAACRVGLQGSETSRAQPEDCMAGEWILGPAHVQPRGGFRRSGVLSPGTALRGSPTLLSLCMREAYQVEPHPLVPIRTCSDQLLVSGKTRRSVPQNGLPTNTVWRLRICGWY